MQYNATGIAFVSCEWFFIAIELVAVTLRLYSRTFLTRSVGSDDFFLTIGFVRFALPTLLVDEQLTATTQVVNIAGVVSDLQSFRNGWSQHESDLTPDMYAAQQKW